MKSLFPLITPQTLLKNIFFNFFTHSFLALILGQFRRKIVLLKNYFNKLYPCQDLKNIYDMRYDEIVLYNIHKKRIITFLQRYNIIPKSIKCKKCRSKMRLEKRPSTDVGYGWRCVSKCRRRRSIYDQSILSEFRINLLKFIKFSFYIFTKALVRRRLFSICA
ncbi:hypothetical protein DMUE_4848 [Dictyocoela muelleri]|nr:hypothetical protein DMUE_4848 [Dictyocoela muelleri]